MKAAFFQFLNKKIGKYLYGFNEQSLNLGIMSGKFELQKLTLKPMEVNKLIAKKLNIPFQLKAGLISKVLVDYGSILQLSNVKIQIDELMIVLKPSYNSIKTGADYYESQQFMEQLTKNYTSYETAINANDKSIFKTFKLKKLIRQLQEGLNRLRGTDSKVSQNQTGIEQNKAKKGDKGIFQQAIDDKLDEMLEKLKISINRIHIRFEDDNISYQNPLAIGLLIENILLLPQKKEILNMINTKVVNVHPDQIQQNKEQIKQLKFLQIQNLSVYIKNQSEQAIPDTLLREVAYQKLGILEVISFDDLRSFLISQFFQNKSDLHIFKIIQIDHIKCNFLHTTSPKTNLNNNNTNITQNSRVSAQSQIQFLNSQLSPIINNYLVQMSISQPQIIINQEYFSTLKDIINFLQNQTYWKQLQKFKPKLRPLVKEYNQNMTVIQKKVNSLIIRDWFKVLVWKMRLQKQEKLKYPDIYKKYQLSSTLYSLEYPQLMQNNFTIFFLQYIFEVIILYDKFHAFVQ